MLLFRELVLEIRVCVSLLLLTTCCLGYNWTTINLPDEHVSCFFRNNPDIKHECEVDVTCPYKSALAVDMCWGYEENCPTDQRMASPKCPDPDHKRLSRNKADQTERFWREADFGYVKGKRDELKTFCKGVTDDDSSLTCSRHAGYCYAKNIYIDMRNDTLWRMRKNDMRYTTDFWNDGEIGGHCKLDKESFEQEGGDTRLLSTWYGELERFTEVSFRPIDDEHCDVIIDKPVIFMKLDFDTKSTTVKLSCDNLLIYLGNPSKGFNMYHHFCDFVNLYISQHINNSLSMDVQIIFWILRSPRYGDAFSETFDAFTEHPIDFLYNYHSKRLCVREAMFPVLARASRGLFYSTPLVPGCFASNLFKAFSEHLVYRLNIASYRPKKNKIRITLLDRAATTRNVLNQDELYEALYSIPEYDVRLVAFQYGVIPYLEQAEISHNSDIFIGMHGAGLTHMLFQPDWGAIIELYNCEDIACYRDLAYLRGLRYFTWEKTDKVFAYSEDPTAMPKFKNYTFDTEEFLRLVSMAATHVRSNPLFTAAHNREIKDEL